MRHIASRLRVTDLADLKALKNAVPEDVYAALSPALPLLVETPEGWMWRPRDIAHRLTPATVNAVWEALNDLRADEALMTPWTTVLLVYAAAGWVPPHSALPAIAELRERHGAQAWFFAAPQLDVGEATPLHAAIVTRCARYVIACDLAAECGALTLLQALRARGRPWTLAASRAAARNGHLHVIQWLHEHGGYWDEWTCAEAADGGHLAVLQWAREHGCPWDKAQCLRCARLSGNDAVVAWIESAA